MKKHYDKTLPGVFIKQSMVLMILLLFCIQDIYAYSLRQFTSKDGLSNSAILSLCQDANGVVWIGSCDGLNIYDGTYLGLHKMADANNHLSGNLIGIIMEGVKDELWIQTNYGLDRFNIRKQTIQRFEEFKENYPTAKSPDGDLFIINNDGYIHCCQVGDTAFCRLDTEKFHREEVRQLVVDRFGVLWVFTSGQDHRSYLIKKRNNRIDLVPTLYFSHPEKILWAFSEGDLLYYIDSTYALYEFDFGNRKSFFITDLENVIRQRGEVSSIIKQEKNYFIGFKNSGLIQLEYLPDSKLGYRVNPINIKAGIFCLMKDKNQNIIWIGTDGQGIYMYLPDDFSIKNILLDAPEYQVSNPIRALFLDYERTLWIGTKGGGIVKMKDYRPNEGRKSGVDILTVNNSVLTDNAVYCFAPSRWKRLWIGTEKGLNYYSYSERRMKEVPLIAGGVTVKYIHSICEPNDSTLFISTVGEGIVRVSLDVSGYFPKVKSTKRIMLDGGIKSANYFFISFQENDSILWFGNRGLGAYRMNIQTEEMRSYRFDKVVNNQTVNDIFAIHKTSKGYWFGTSFGLAHLNENEYRVYNETDGFPNNTIHGILEGIDNNLWLSTNQGMVRFNENSHTIQIYRQQGIQEVNEFSDGAFFKDEQTGTLFFGGTNGFITINENKYTAKDYMPDLCVNHLSIFGKDCNLYDFMQDEEEPTLVLDYTQNFFNLSFLVIDYINGHNYTYFYKIDGLSDSWVENGSSTTAAFSNLAPGKYKLLMKYRSNIIGRESPIYSLIIRITPPWYLTNWAQAVYSVLIVLLVSGSIWMIIIRFRKKRYRMIEEVSRQQREELYESKLRFFTNITHEFCTPLTLIYGPCEKILSYQKVDSYVRRYASLIQQNALKLNELILELIDFRRVETGNKMLHIASVCVSEQIKKIAESFDELADSRKMDYQLQIEKEINWNTDLSCLSKIVTNLISNAFKYTPDYGKITIELFMDGEQLCIRISNTGKGIKEADLPKVFDRYKILDNLGTQTKNGISMRNGLGLAICHSMVTLMNGKIEVSSIPDELTSFTVHLPLLEIPVENDEKEKQQDAPELPSYEQSFELENSLVAPDKNKQTIMIIDDDPSMLWFVTEIFVETYNVIPLKSADEAFKQLSIRLPHLIISDVMMPGTDGMTFAKKIKQDKLLCHIPLILLSALHSIDEQAKGFESGAEAFVTKPFNVEYLGKVVKRLLQRDRELKEYYSSTLSAFELNDGHFQHKEDKSFFEDLMRMIDNHIANPALSVDVLSSNMGYSTRQFYRKLKNITDQTPADIIKDYRLSIVERLLLTTQLSIEEIMGRTGFANRATLYKAFAKKHGMTPKQYRTIKSEDIQNTSDNLSAN